MLIAVVSLDGVALVAAVVGAVLMWVVPSFAVGRIAKGRGRRFWVWFVAAVIWSPILVGVVVLVIRDRSKPDEGEELSRPGFLANSQAEPVVPDRPTRRAGP